MQKRQFTGALGWAAATTMAAQLARRVEDGQFEREYSRLYMGLLLGMGLGLAVIVAVGVGNRLTRRAHSSD